MSIHIKSKHPCRDCGKPCCEVSQRCRSCNAKFKWKQGVLSLKHFPTGAANKNWKGGRVTRGSSYVFLLMHEHPRASKSGYVPEHIVIWEQFNKKPVPPGWVIHHLNGIKTDNRPKNLVALTSRKHYLVLAAKAKRIQELEALLNGQSQLI